ncbi:MAG: SDR family oxidoreductase [Candidatus Omnitrophica bacterium]|nr:SDR family oxidoreductase [Candidatus Omnitrophota bacterium]
MQSSLKGKKVLVTGGAGFIGSHIVDRLLKEEAQVVVLDNLANGTLDNLRHCLQRITFIEKDLRDQAALEEALSGVDLICHQAALRSVPKSVAAPLEYHDVNVTGTMKLFLKAKEKGIKKIVYASSSSVYGERDDFPEKETDYPKPISPYATTKLIGEDYACTFSKLWGMEIVSLRYFNVYGPRQSLEDEYAVVVPKFTTCLLKGQPVPIYGDGEQERDFTFIDNVVEANILALIKEGIGAEVFNIANGLPNSVNNLFFILREITGMDINPVYEPPRPGDVRKTHADISKAERLLGWIPKVGFKEGLEKTVAWFAEKYKV